MNKSKGGSGYKLTDRLLVVLVDEQAQGDFVHPLALGKGEGLAHEASESLAQGVVPTLDVAGLACALVGAAVGAARKDLVVSQPKVAAGGAAAVIRRDALTQSAGALGRAIPDEASDDLARLPTKRDPHPARIELAAHEAPEFVEFEHVALLGGQERRAQRRQGFGFFSSHLEIVPRATPKMRCAARRLRRSVSTARSTSALRSGAVSLLLGASTR